MALQLEVDIASVDGNKPPSVEGFTKMKRAGITQASIRGVYGRPANGQAPVFVDPIWLRDKDAVVAAGLKRSSYVLLCVPRKGMFTPEPEAQIDAFCDYVTLDRPVCGQPPHDMVGCIDVEEASDILNAEEYFQWVLRAARQYRKRVGVWPQMYTSHRVWHEYLGDHLPGQLAACPLWIAKPWPVPPDSPAIMDGAPGYKPDLIPQFGNSWSGYQYQGDALGIPGLTATGDLSRFNIVGQGANGQWVMWIQARAGGLSIDGNFGPATKSRIQALQADYKLDADGIVGNGTQALLGWLNPAPL